MILAAIGIGRSIEVVTRSNQTRTVAAFTDEVTSLAHALQVERFVTGVYLEGGHGVRLERVQELWPASQRAAEVVRDHSRALEVDNASLLRTALTRVFADLDRVDDVRRGVRDRTITKDEQKEPVYLRAANDLLLLRVLGTDASRERLTTIAGDLKRSADRSLLYYGAAVLLALALAVGISLPIAGSMVRALRRLHDASLEVAERELPGVVARLQRARSIEELDVESPPITVDSRDEIGQVAVAFNAVHRVAVRTALEQAGLRKSIGDMFMNLARRSQTLLDRQIGLIDQLERAEQDPDALENLFKLDHLATRMRRNAENLIVLSGAEPSRRWGQPVGLARVIRAAIAEVEDYTRVELLPLENVRVRGQVVGDLVHLLAELIENATSFSPPNTRVLIAGSTVSSGYVLEIEDRGIGMTDSELVSANQRLADPPMIEFALDRMLGFFVVGRLAQRYDLKVELRHSWYGGITALVLLPEQMLVREDEVPGLPDVTGEQAAVAAAPWSGARGAITPPDLATAGRGPTGPMGPMGAGANAGEAPGRDGADPNWFDTPVQGGPDAGEDWGPEAAPQGEPGQVPVAPRSPGEVRSMLAQYRTTWARGRPGGDEGGADDANADGDVRFPPSFEGENGAAR